MRLVVIAGMALFGVGCIHGMSVTQPTPTTAAQMIIVNEMRQLEPMLGMGEFVAFFQAPPAGQAYAGWAPCQLDGSGKPPWAIYFNEAYVESQEQNVPYLKALVAHEMCHHWVHKQTGVCGLEQAANVCADSLLANGRPE